MKCSNVIFLTMISSLVALCAKAGSYSTPLDNTIWQVEESIFACSMTQPIPRFGSVTFIDEAGLPLMLQVKSPTLKKHADTINIYSTPAPWHPFGTNVEHGSNPVQNQSYRQESGATELLDKMNNGLWGQLDILADARLQHRVTLSSVNITNVLNQFIECRQYLLPVNFEQIKHTIIYYNSGKRKHSNKYQQTLQNMVTYILADPRVKHIEIDGHTDGIGESLPNRTLSRERAQHIQKLFVNSGIAETTITTRFHGDRYPVSSNNTHEGRNQNRRVEIRLYQNERQIPKATVPKLSTPKKSKLSINKENTVLFRTPQ